MFLKYSIIIILTFSTVCAQDIDTTFVSKTNGLESKHYIIGFMQNEIEENKGTIILKICITSSYKTRITIKEPYSDEKNIEILPDTAYTFIMDFRLENIKSEIAMQNLVEITSDRPISVYVLSSQRTTSESYTAVPVSKWGTEYVVISMPNDQYAAQSGIDSLKNAIPRRSEFMVMSAFDSTWIYYTPTVNTDKGKLGGTPQQVMLQKGECYLVQSGKYPMGQGDLTGTIVTGNKPFGVLSGHVRTSSPQGMPNPLDPKNCIVEMLMPVQNWAKEFFTIPFGVNTTGDIFKVTSYYPNTNVTYITKSGSSSQLLKKPGDCLSIKDITLPVYWKSDNPVQLAQMMYHNGLNGDTEYDPALVMINGINQFGKKATFVSFNPDTLNSGMINNHWLYLICDSLAVDDIKLDSTLIINITGLKTQIVFGTNYHYALLKINSGFHSLESNYGSFSGVIFGTDLADAYAMQLGAGLINPDINSPKFVISDSCGNLTGYISDNDNNYTGIESCSVITNQTYNYHYEIGKIEDTTSIINFTAEPINYDSSANIVLEVTDWSGNSDKFSYFYEPLKINIDKDSIGLNNLNKIKFIKSTAKIKNNGLKSVQIKNLSFDTLDTRLSIEIKNPLPIILQPNDSIIVGVNYKQNEAKTDFSNILKIDFGCDSIKKIPITGDFVEYLMDAIGWTYGIVNIGDTLCKELNIYNGGTKEFILSGFKQINYPDNFIYDTTGLFPINVKPGDTIKIRVCFKPTEEIYYTDTLIYVTNPEIKNNVVLKGVGKKPISVDEDKDNNITQLEQNIPNPFSENTSINYYIGKAGIVRLYVSDLLGNKLITLFDGFNNPGDYSSEFQNNRLPSGLYIYTLEINDVRISRKLQIIN